MVFAFVIDEQAQGTLRFVKLFFDLFLGSFQVRNKNCTNIRALPYLPCNFIIRNDYYNVGNYTSVPLGNAGGHSLLLCEQRGES